jgi:SAM-dependent methyltransferase
VADYLDVNRAQWDERADIHATDATGFYAIDRFMAGEDILTPIDAGEIVDIAGLRVLHLQCHFGLDTLCLVRRGAIATGIDFSPRAIRHARNLAARSGVGATFVEGNVYDAAALAGGNFDLVYTTWGTICWLPDIARWGAVVASLLKPGGRLYLVDGHPGAAILEEVDGRLVPTYGWRTPPSAPLMFEASQTYTGDERQLANTKSHEWIHPVGDIVSALLDNGMILERLTEHEVLPWRMFGSMEPAGDRLFRLPANWPRLPLALSLSAVKRA